ncbi:MULTISPECIES: hypothetical protein [Bacillus]|uniref:hypothetical protein n=1 Tax=Bacillus TaxID=1386 RepID=UPI001E3016B3|nr:hypothetical protein [Bacillus rhizoplanae]
MNISEKLTQQQFEEILMYIYKRGQESKNVEAKYLIEEIKQQLISITHTSKESINFKK